MKRERTVYLEVSGPTMAELEARARAQLDQLDPAGAGDGDLDEMTVAVRPLCYRGDGTVSAWTAEVTYTWVERVS